MGTLTLSGVLKRPISGDVVPNARITFDAIATGNVVLKGVSSSCKTASDGSYSVDLEYGDYTIQVSWAGQTQQYGTVHIDDTTPTGSLNDVLMQELTESQLTPEIVLEFRQLEQEMQDDLAQMEDLNTDAAGSASAAASSAMAAATSETNAAASEDAAAASASAAKALKVMQMQHRLPRRLQRPQKRMRRPVKMQLHHRRQRQILPKQMLLAVKQPRRRRLQRRRCQNPTQQPVKRRQVHPRLRLKRLKQMRRPARKRPLPAKRMQKMRGMRRRSTLRKLKTLPAKSRRH